MSFYQNFARILSSSAALASPCFGGLDEDPLNKTASAANAAAEAAELEGDKMLRLIDEIYSVKFSGEFPEIQEGDETESGFKVARTSIEMSGEAPVQAKTWYFVSLEQMEDFRSRIDFLLNLVVSYSKAEEVDRRVHNRKTSENLAQEGVHKVVDELFAIATEAAKKKKCF